MNTIKVLYIDDEEHNLRSFMATFRRQYDVYTAVSASAARAILDKKDIHIIISDQRMPEVTGVQFFKSIKNIYPNPIRILLTGYTDIEALADAVNEGHIYRYLTKPWNELELNNSILNAYETYQNRVALKQKIDELQKTNDQLNRFIYSISHELRAPLASALGVIELVKIDKLMDPRTIAGEYWVMMEDCCKKLDHNITKTLLYYRNSRYEIANEEIDFVKLVNELVSLHSRANNITNQIDFTVKINQPVSFRGDSFRIETAIGNLISNAIKYQRPDETEKKIDITVTVSDFNVAITVADNGYGIPHEDLERIFTQFFRGKHNEGAGLGLFITKEALDRINGKISVESDTGKGSAFMIIIPNHKD